MKQKIHGQYIFFVDLVILILIVLFKDTVIC